MPRRNLRWLTAVALFSLICHQYVPASRYSRVLADNMDRIVENYYRPIDEAQLFENAMRGMAPDDEELRKKLETQLDRHTLYVKAAGKDDFKEDLDQQFIGIGVFLAIKDKMLVVVSPIPGGPAIEAGVRTEDRILKIEGQSTESMTVDDAKARVKGCEGTSVKITVLHAGAAKPTELAIVRRTVREDTVKGATRGPDGGWKFLLPGHPRIGYVAIKAFADADEEKNTSADFRAAMEQLRKDNLRGLVIDLRDNRGGSLWSAIRICRMLVSKGEIVTTRGRDHQILSTYRANGNAAYADIPIAVLVNGLSGTHSEIVAACLQDNERAVVFGQRSYGKGTVQEVFDLGQPLGMLKMTIATYWRPSGKDINRPTDDGKNLPWGVSPNDGCEVPVSEEEHDKLLLNQQEREVAQLTGEKPPTEVPDRVLQKAVEWLDAK